jgi:hypothetical protein
MDDFRKLATMTPQEAWLTGKEAPTTHGIGLGLDAAQYETTVPPADSAAVARRIIAAGETARSGGTVLSVKLSNAAEKILAAGKARRAEG